MELISHKNPTLSVCQRLFIEKSLELLHLGSIDSYRVRLHNPKTILEEIKYCLIEYQKGRIKHFQTIKAKEKDKKALIDEAIFQIETNPNYLDFSVFTKEFLLHLLHSVSDQNYKKLISSIELLTLNNQNYLNKVLDGILNLVSANNTALEELEKIDLSLNILFSELISRGYSKYFLSRLVYGIFVNTLTAVDNFADHFENFRLRLLMPPSEHEVVFRVDTTPKVHKSISVITHPTLTVSDNINDINLTGRKGANLATFNSTAPTRKFIRSKVIAPDYFAALKKARTHLAEYLDVINLGLSDEFMSIHNRVLVIDMRSPEKAQFQNNTNILDGKYNVTINHYRNFARKLPSILSNGDIQDETKEKIKSAVRYLRLGNQSIEVEHKFLNYWIGLEYLFSNYESQSTVNRIKEHFIAAHSLAYVKRNTHSFKKDFGQIPTADQALIASYTPLDGTCLKTPTFYDDIGNVLITKYPLLAYRAMKLSKWFFPPGKPANAAEYLKKHMLNLEIHFTRIYRLRNEIIHDAATNTNNEHITSNLRYYLTFILNEVIDFFSNLKSKGGEISIDDYFTMNEIELGNIENSKYPLSQLLDVDCSIDFIAG